MLDMGPQPYDADAALRMGHNSRAAEIKSVAKEISEAKAKYLKDNIRAGVPNKVKVLYAASISSMSDAAFRQMFVSLSFANRDCDNLSVGHKRVAMLLDRSERSVQRVAKELEETGWLSTPRRQGRAPSVRTASIPDKTLNAIIFEIFDTTNLSDRTEVPDLALRKSDPPEMADREHSSTNSNGQICHFRPDKSVDRTIIEYNHGVVLVAPERAPDPERLEEQDYEGYREMFNSWGIRPAQREQNRQLGTDWPRSSTDPTLVGAVRAQLGAGHPAKIVILAARNTIDSMMVRIRMQVDQHGGGRSGVQSYFQKEFAGNIRFLLEEQRAADQANQKPPPTHRPQNWHEANAEHARRGKEAVFGGRSKS